MKKLFLCLLLVFVLLPSSLISATEIYKLQPSSTTFWADMDVSGIVVFDDSFNGAQLHVNFNGYLNDSFSISERFDNAISHGTNFTGISSYVQQGGDTGLIYKLNINGSGVTSGAYPNGGAYYNVCSGACPGGTWISGQTTTTEIKSEALNKYSELSDFANDLKAWGDVVTGISLALGAYTGDLPGLLVDGVLITLNNLLDEIRARETEQNATIISGILESLLGGTAAIGGIFTGSPTAILGGIGAMINGVAAIVQGSALDELEIANDPPDFNYQEVAEYTNYEFNLTTGLGEGADQYLNEMLESFFHYYEGINNQLVSMERAQGAYIDGDLEKGALHDEAFQLFSDEEEMNLHSALSYLTGIPDLLEASNLIEFLPPDLLTELPSMYADLALVYQLDEPVISRFNKLEYPIDVEMPTIPEPEPVPLPSTLALLMLGLLVISYQRRRPNYPVFLKS